MMMRSLTRGRLYRVVAIVLSAAMAAALIPPQGWGRLFSPAPARAAPAEAGAATPGQPLSISRVQSAYRPAETISGTLIITFSVTNDSSPAVPPQLSDSATLTDTAQAWQQLDLRRDPNAVRHVLLVDTPAANVTFISSTPRFDHKGSQYAWNLGDIPPMGSLTVTLVVSAPQAVAEKVMLDIGAQAWGTFQNRAVSAQACPAVLMPDTLDGQPIGEYLAPAVEADFRDEYVARLAGQMCPDPSAAFDYVRALGYEAYKGSLRGARGALWSQAGNSLDKSSLLIATLRGNGVPARYRHGTLSVERAQELILSMFPSKPRFVGYIPEGARVADPANDPKLLAEVRDHWWVEAYQDGAWMAMDPSFSYAAPGQTFATPEGSPLAQPPDALRHTVTVSLKTERYEMLTYLLGGFVYDTPLTYTLTTAELVGRPLTLKHLVSTQFPPFGCMIAFICWKHHTYVPYLRVGDPDDQRLGRLNTWAIQGHPFWELLSSYPFGQSAITAEWLIFEVRDADGNLKTYTRELADRVGIDQRNSAYKIRGLIPELLTSAVLTRFGMGAPALATEADNHTIYFNPSLMAPEYAAHVGENMVSAAPRIVSVQPLVTGLDDIGRVMSGERIELLPQMEIATEVAEDTTQAFNWLMGASFVTFSDAASRELAETGLVRAYPDSPRITIVSTIIAPSSVVSQVVPLQMIDLLHDSLRVIAYPGQVTSAEPTYRMTRGVNEAALEKMVGERLTGQPGHSAVSVLEAASLQGIAMMYVDANHLDLLTNAPLSTQAKARIVQAAQQGYGLFVPERMVTLNGRPTLAWWQLDLATGEMVGVGEDGTHQFLVQLPAYLRLVQALWDLSKLLMTFFARYFVWKNAARFTWDYFWNVQASGATTAADYANALAETKRIMNNTVWPQFQQACEMSWLDLVLYCEWLR